MEDAAREYVDSLSCDQDNIALAEAAVRLALRRKVIRMPGLQKETGGISKLLM